LRFRVEGLVGLLSGCRCVGFGRLGCLPWRWGLRCRLVCRLSRLRIWGVSGRRMVFRVVS